MNLCITMLVSHTCNAHAHTHKHTHTHDTFSKIVYKKVSAKYFDFKMNEMDNNKN